MRPTHSQATFFDRLSQTDQKVLLLDYDGTIAPFRTVRDEALPYDSVLHALRAIQERNDTRMVFISGRCAVELSRLLERSQLRCEVWGSHGLERKAPDSATTVAIARDPEVLALAGERLAQAGVGGNNVEVKPASVAVHWRGEDAARAVVLQRIAQDVFGSLSSFAELRVLPFDGGLELISGSWNKGDAVRAILGETGHSAAVAYLGDDLTDEDAFAALRGHGIGVLVRDCWRPTNAEVWLRPPDELVDFLQAWSTHSGGAA